MAADYNMSNDLQVATLVVVPVVILGLWALIGMLVRDVRANDRAKEAEQDAAAHDLQRIVQRHSIATFAKDLFIGRDLHTDIRDQLKERRSR